MVLGYFIGDTYCKTPVVHEYRPDTFLRTLRKGRRGSYFFCHSFIRGEQIFFKKKFSSPPVMSYNKFCTVPQSGRHSLTGFNSFFSTYYSLQRWVVGDTESCHIAAAFTLCGVKKYSLLRRSYNLKKLLLRKI